jgi:catechol 2,3-dioxygenase
MSPIDPDLRIGAVHLAVSDLPRSIDFYERLLGLPLLSSDEETASLGPDQERPALVLTRLQDPVAAPRGSTGLFHVAWLHPSRGSLAETVRRLAAGGWPFEGASDHGVSEALYLSDPDGLGIEIYADRPREQWQREPGGHGVRMYTLPLDLEDLLAQFKGTPGPAIAAGSGVGHVHLKVADVPRADAFYRDVLGFEEQAQIPSAAFLSAGGYHHHVGLNSWQSRGGAPAPENAPGLRRVDFELASSETLADLRQRVTALERSADGGDGEGELALRDPDGQLLAFSSGA